MSCRPNAIDLFAGPGGLSLGMRLAGINVVGAIEWDKYAGRTYAANLGEHVEICDIKEFGPAKMEKHLRERGKITRKSDIDLICGGPPCPGFSLIGRSKISSLIRSGKWKGSDHRHQFIDDPRNQLFLEFVKYVDHFKPKYLVMENVEGMLSYLSKKGNPITETIRDVFESAGYSVEIKMLDASDYGVPQSRKRVFFLGSRKGIKKALLHPQPIGVSILASDAIRDLPSVDPRTGMPVSLLLKRKSRAKQNWARYLNWVRSPPQSGFSSNGNLNQVTLHQTRPVNPRDQAIFPLLTSGEKGPRVLFRDIEPRDIAPLLPKGYELVNGSTEGYLVVGPKWGGRGAGKWKWYDRKKFGDKMRRIRGDRPAPTVVAHLSKDGYLYVHPEENRTITVREAARFQSFPDWFDFSAGGQNALSQQYKQVGNAVPPLMAWAIGEEIMRVLGLHPQGVVVEDVYKGATCKEPRTNEALELFG